MPRLTQALLAAAAVGTLLSLEASGAAFQVQTSALRVRDPPSVRGSYESAVGDVRARSTPSGPSLKSRESHFELQAASRLAALAYAGRLLAHSPSERSDVPSFGRVWPEDSLFNFATQFGIPGYGGSLVGELFYYPADPQACRVPAFAQLALSRQPTCVGTSDGACFVAFVH